MIAVISAFIIGIILGFAIGVWIVMSMVEGSI